MVQGLINTVRAAAPNNIIVVPSNSWDQKTGDAASDPPTGGNLMFTAHIYASNWNSTFQTPGRDRSGQGAGVRDRVGLQRHRIRPASGPGLQTTLNGDGASWTAWVTDNSWAPPMFSDASITTLNTFGMQVKSWLAATATSDWVQ